jgi:hypothetical protein
LSLTVASTPACSARSTKAIFALDTQHGIYRIGTRIYQRKLDGAQEAHLIAVAGSPPPAERGRWTLKLLADRMVALGYVDSLSYETVRQTLKKTHCARI